jgi:4'-phosphopantetheinyl transferase EntD
MTPARHDAALPAQIEARLRAMVPLGTAVAVDLIGPAAPFDAVEAEAVARAIPARRDSFATGRRLARGALTQLGCNPSGLPPDGDGVPCWPEGFLGSISHSDNLCIALAGREAELAGIGVDIERTGRVRPGLARHICRPDETDAQMPIALRFVAKEAFIKACFPRTRCLLGFQEVRIDASGPDGFEVRVAHGRPALQSVHNLTGGFIGRFALFAQHAAAAVWVAR